MQKSGNLQILQNRIHAKVVLCIQLKCEEKPKHLKVVCKSVHWQQPDQWARSAAYEICWQDGPHTVKQERQDRRFD